ncbi:hypothetical protein AYO49_03425 [Verrucomicrobiaceae bacterium SCGC AG-212-N21]|nr:hypothetical protein AYO49_03425 [Verrucomicrobiaceae bacterium SCGC AG-212-N21]
MKKRTWFKRSSLIISTAVSLVAPMGKVTHLNESKNPKPCKKSKAPLSSVAGDSDADSSPPFGDQPVAEGPPLINDALPPDVITMEEVGEAAWNVTSVDSSESTSVAPAIATPKPVLARALAESEPAAVPRYAWKANIHTTVFWIGEQPTEANPTPNHESSWDAKWTQNYGGYDNPDPNARNGFRPAAFTPKQNPFYVALPYNDISKNGHKEEARKIIPWFKQGEGTSRYKSKCKGRWIAIRKGDRVCYAQWEDAGPFTTTDGDYVFGDARPQAEASNGAGLDVSPAVRDFLGLDGHDKTDWKFVEFEEVPVGPWAEHGANNDFVMNRKAAENGRVAQTQKPVRRSKPGGA